MLQPHRSRATCRPRASGWLKRSLLPAELSMLPGWDVQEPSRIVHPHSLISGMSIWETGRALAPLLPALDRCQGHAWPALSLQTGHREGDHACQTQLLPSVFWETCPASHPGHPVLVWVMFSYRSLVTESFPCVIWPLLKEASKEHLGRSIIPSPEGEAGHCGHAGDSPSSKYSVEIHFTLARGLWQPQWLPHTRKGSHAERVLLAGRLRARRLLLV